MVPAVRAQTGGVAKPALHLVGEQDRRDELAARGARSFSGRERGGDVVAGVRRFLREVGVVVIEVADEAAVGERGPIRRRGVARAEQRRAVRCVEPCSHAARDGARLGVPRAQSAADGVDHAPLHLVHGGGRQVFKAQCRRKVSQSLSESSSHASVSRY